MLSFLKKNSNIMLFVGFFMMLTSSSLENLRGPVSPGLMNTYQLDEKAISSLYISGYVVSILVSILFSFLIKKYSKKNLTFMGLGGVFIALTSSLLIDNSMIFIGPYPLSLLLWGGGLACAIGSFFGLCNYLVASAAPSHLRGRYLACLHLLYAVGSLLPGQFVKLGYYGGLNWRFPLIIPLIFALCILLLTFFWKEVSSGGQKFSCPKDKTPTFYKERWGQYFLAVLLFSFYVPFEVLSSNWMNTFLESARNLDKDVSNNIYSCFFLILGGVRLLCSIFLKEEWEEKVVLFSLVGAFIFYILGIYFSPWLLAGMGITGAFFPIMMTRVGKVFPETNNALLVWIPVGINIMMALTSYLTGDIGESFGIEVAYYLPGVFFIFTLILLQVFHRITKYNAGDEDKPLIS